MFTPQHAQLSLYPWGLLGLTAHAEPRWAGGPVCHGMVDGVLETELLDGKKKENWDHVWSTTLSKCRAGP